MTLAVAGTCGYCHGSQTLGCVLDSKSAGKHAVTGCILNDIGITQTNAVHGACHGIGPLVKVFL